MSKKKHRNNLAVSTALVDSAPEYTFEHSWPSVRMENTICLFLGRGCVLLATKSKQRVELATATVTHMATYPRKMLS